MLVKSAMLVVFGMRVEVTFDTIAELLPVELVAVGVGVCWTVVDILLVDTGIVFVVAELSFTPADVALIEMVLGIVFGNVSGLVVGIVVVLMSGVETPSSVDNIVTSVLKPISVDKMVDSIGGTMDDWVALCVGIVVSSNF